MIASIVSHYVCLGRDNLVIIVFVFYFIPETKGRSFVQLGELFAKRVHLWKFKCVTEQFPAAAEKNPEHLVPDTRKYRGSHDY